MIADPTEAAVRDEGRRFGAYLLGVDPPEASVRLYIAAMNALDLAVPVKDQRLLSFVARHRWSIGFVDGGLALLRPSSVMRTKLLTMSAILETNPELASLFLPVHRRIWYVGYAAFVAFRAAAKAAIGIPLVIWI